MKHLIAAALLLAPALALAAEREVISFRTDAKVVLDPAGTPLSIEAAEDLPAPVRAFIEQRVSTWRFSVRKREGQAGGAVTYVNLGACAIPVEGGGYRLAVDFKGNGPAIVGRPSMPDYPLAARRAGQSASAIVALVVEADGSAVLEDIEFVESAGSYRSDFSTAIKSWARRLRYAPEEFDGHPVRTRVELPVQFKTDGPGGLEQWRQRHRERQLGSSECRLAVHGEEEMLPVAMDSPVQVLPAG